MSIFIHQDAEGVKVSIIASDKERLQGAYVGLSAAILKWSKV